MEHVHIAGFRYLKLYKWCSVPSDKTEYYAGHIIYIEFYPVLWMNLCNLISSVDSNCIYYLGSTY
jgi:hypothetical protein